MHQFLFRAAIVKPCVVIIWFNLYAALVRTEEASFTAQSIADSQKQCLGEENSQETMAHSRYKMYFTNIQCVILDFIFGSYLQPALWS
jgi:hypothetical protein